MAKKNEPAEVTDSSQMVRENIDLRNALESERARHLDNERLIEDENLALKRKLENITAAYSKQIADLTTAKSRAETMLSLIRIALEGVEDPKPETAEA